MIVRGVGTHRKTLQSKMIPASNPDAFPKGAQKDCMRYSVYKESALAFLHVFQLHSHR